MQIGVIGSGSCDEETYKIAYRVGELIAERGGILINGGLGGVMEASAKGAKSKGGITVGVLPRGVEEANPYIDIKIATNMGHARNMIIVHSSDALISIGGEYGTISELAIALKERKRVASLKPPVILRGMKIFENAEEAVDYVLSD
ncbi:MAG: TIGR00725 family protein [Archaeoglobaceae archaeon]